MMQALKHTGIIGRRQVFMILIQSLRDQFTDTPLTVSRNLHLDMSIHTVILTSQRYCRMRGYNVFYPMDLMIMDCQLKGC
jgi:hypothetical protein